MTIIKLYEHSGYAVSESGKLFRAVHIAKAWRLSTLADTTQESWEFVNEVKYQSCMEALEDCDNW